LPVALSSLDIQDGVILKGSDIVFETKRGAAFLFLVARMPKYLFRLNNGSPEDHVVDLPHDSAALDEGLRTAAGMVRDISLPHIGSETHMLEVTEDGGKRLLTVEIRASRNR
jgi:hypothetical protein